MHRPIILASLTAGLAIAGLTVAPAAAAAAITASSITSPPNGSSLLYNGDNGSGAVEVHGTVTGATDGTKADLLCYDKADSETFRLLTGADVSSGTFAGDVSLKPVAGRACRLRLVPNGFTPPTGNGAQPFAGPVISVSDEFSHSGDGNLWGYDVLSGTLQSSFELQSLGECPVLASFVTDPNSLGSFQLFSGDACLPEQSGIVPNVGTRSAVQIDSQNAYPPGAISKLSGLAGFLPIDFAPAFSANHDEVTISETDPLMICSTAGVFPPTTANCPGLEGAGIQITSKTTLLDGGTVARVDQTVQNTDTHAHTVDLLFNQSVTAPASGETPGFEFPGQTTFAGHQAPDSFASFPSGPGSIIAVSDSGSQPSPSNPIGAITYGQPPTEADFISAAGAQVGTFVMHYTATLAPNATTNYGWSFTQATSTGTLSGTEQIERDRFSAPTIKIDHPPNRATARHRDISVTGVVSDPVGISSVRVAGKAVKLASGAFSTSVLLKPGKNLISVTATNLASNSSTAEVRVTYNPLPCVVPALRGRTLARARRALARHDCRAGKVVRVHSRKVRKGHVVGTRPAAHSRHKPFSKVRLFVSRGRGLAHRHVPAARAVDASLGL